jgi:hypothetical protein
VWTDRHTDRHDEVFAIMRTRAKRRESNLYSIYSSYKLREPLPIREVTYERGHHRHLTATKRCVPKSGHPQPARISDRIQVSLCSTLTLPISRMYTRNCRQLNFTRANSGTYFVNYYCLSVVPVRCWARWGSITASSYDPWPCARNVVKIVVRGVLFPPVCHMC